MAGAPTEWRTAPKVAPCGALDQSEAQRRVDPVAFPWTGDGLVRPVLNEHGDVDRMKIDVPAATTSGSARASRASDRRGYFLTSAWISGGSAKTESGIVPAVALSIVTT